MSATLHLATLEDLDRLEPMVAAFHSLEGIDSDEENRRNTLARLLEGTPHGVIYLIGMRRAPVGYIAISFGFSIESKGIVGFIDEFFIRENVGGRGMGTEVLASLSTALGQNGIKALHLRVERDNVRAQRMYARAGFRMREGYCLMTKQH